MKQRLTVLILIVVLIVLGGCSSGTQIRRDWIEILAITVPEHVYGQVPERVTFDWLVHEDADVPGAAALPGSQHVSVRVDKGSLARMLGGELLPLDTQSAQTSLAAQDLWWIPPNDAVRQMGRLEIVTDKGRALRCEVFGTLTLD